MTVSSTSDQILHPWGFHTKETSYLADGFGDSGWGGSAIAFNACNIVGYIPGIGCIPAVIRFIVAISGHADKKHRPFNASIGVRGVFEFLGLGVICLVLDIIVSIGRFTSCCQSEPI